MHFLENCWHNPDPHGAISQRPLPPPLSLFLTRYQLCIVSRSQAVCVRGFPPKQKGIDTQESNHCHVHPACAALTVAQIQKYPNPTLLYTCTQHLFHAQSLVTTNISTQTVSARVCLQQINVIEPTPQTEKKKSRFPEKAGI